jgi:two-component system chemotaxis response regulator CheY
VRPSETAGHALKILVVDDLSTMRRIIRGILTDLGHDDVHEAEDGELALQKLRAARFDFVMSDIDMPNVDGFDLLEAIRRDPSLRCLPVLMVTAEARREDIVRAAQLRASGYIVKPFTRETLRSKLERIAGQAA